MDPEGQVHRVPFHRVRAAYQDTQRIWHPRLNRRYQNTELFSLFLLFSAVQFLLWQYLKAIAILSWSNWGE